MDLESKRKDNKNSSLIFIIEFIVIVIVFFLIAYLFQNYFNIFGRFLLNKIGFFAFLIIFILDYIIQPFPPDIFVYSYILTGANVLAVIFLSTIMSVLAGIGAFYTAKYIDDEKVLKYIGKKNYKKTYSLFEKFGIWAIVIAAFSPIPFSLSCWVAGLADMNSKKFILTITVARFTRFTFVALFTLIFIENML